MRVEIPLTILPDLIGVGFLSFLFMGISIWALLELEDSIYNR